MPDEGVEGLAVWHTSQLLLNQKEKKLAMRPDAGPQPNKLPEDHRLFLQKEEEELTMRPVPLRDIPLRGGCAQTHIVPSIQRRPQNLFPDPIPHGRRSLQPRSPKSLEPTSASVLSSTHFRALSSAAFGSWRCSSQSSSRVLFLPKCCLCEMDRKKSFLSLAAFMAHRSSAFWASCGYFTPTALLITL